MLGGQRPPLALTVTSTCGFVALEPDPTPETTTITARTRSRASIPPVYGAAIPFVTLSVPAAGADRARTSARGGRRRRARARSRGSSALQRRGLLRPLRTAGPR